MTKYLGSTKNLAGSALGLVGVLLYVFGVVGSYWPAVVVALYAAGALLAPGERKHVPAIEGLRTDLATVVAKANRLPGDAAQFVHRIDGIITEMLARVPGPDPDLTHRMIRLVRTDLPTSIDAYLTVPERLARPDELLVQLDLIEYEAHQIAERFYADDINRQADHTRYLRDRAGRPEA